ncbi:MAG TPA: immunoglobulin domain-containing protein, partial [Lacunisphaera sp.]|nr:immunoglobulin domain-containing protein [Lacunisphaera sp.]
GGKSVVFGSIDLVGSTITNQAVQLNDDGSLDGSFPQGSGFVLNGLSRFGVYKAILQGDGKYLVVGDLVGYNGNPAYRMMRVNADGSFDSSFNVQGGPSTVFPPMIGLSGGRTLLYNLSNGYTFNGQGVGALVRLNEDGSRDTSFPLGAGLLNGTNNATVTFAAEQPDGKLLLAGTMTTYNGTTVTGNVIRLNEDGSLDSSFNPGSGVSAGSITTGVVLPDGSAILAGSFTSYNGTPVNRVVKIMANGTIDPGFTAPAAIDNTVGQVVAQADGKFILVGDFVNTPAPYAVRLNSNGTVDNTFALTGLTGGFGSSARIFLGDDGSVYVYNNPVSYNYGVPLAYARFRGAPVAPGVATQPAAVSTTVGGKATFYVKASGTAPFSYQWRKNGTPLSNSATIDGANYSILNLTNVAAGDAGNYDVLITSPFGGPVTSNAVALTVGSLLPTIDTQPVSASVNAGQETSLTVAVSGTGPFHYQWRRNGVNVGTDSATLDFPNPTVADAGAYTVVITNGNGSTTSATATLTVNLAPAAGVEAVDQGFVRPEFRRTSLPGRVTKGINGEVYLTWSNASSVTGANNVRLGAVVRVSANGTLDPSFAPGSFLADAWAIVPLANGQLLVGGLASSETYESGQPAYRVFRLNADGSRDASYGSPVFTSIPRYMTLQADGKLLVAPSGGFYPNGGLSNLVRLNQDGSVDSGFTSPTFDVTNSIFATVLVDGSGNIIIGGTFKTVNGTTVPGIARLQANGTLDGTFLPSGFTSTATVQVRGLGLQTQGGNAGKILVAGSGLKVSGTAYPVIRLNANGSLDNSFTLQPTATVIGANGVRPRLLNVLADDSFTTVSATVTKFDANGNLAAGYNQPVFSNESYWMETLADGSVLVAPEYGTTVNGTPVNGPFRLTNTGGLDSGFTPPAPFQTEVYPNNFTIQPDGKVLIWGNFDTVNSMARHGMALIGPDGSLDSFNLSGVPNLYSVAGAFRFADGHILANTLVGTYQNNLGGGVVRFNANGTVDSGFSLAPSVNGNGIEPLPDGHILAGGMDTATLLAGGPVLQRVDSSGALDGSFTGPNASAFGAVYRTGGSPSTITSFVQGVFSIAGHYDDGRALVIATVPNGSYPANATSLDMTLVRIKTDGSIDTGFTAPVVPWSTVSAFTVPLVDPQNTGLGAQQYQGVFVNGSPFSGVVPQSDGGVIVFGIFTNIGGHAAPGIARLKNDGSFDTGFSVGTGPALSAPAGRSPQVESVDVAPDGSYWITGVFDSFNGTPAPGIVKLKADGTVDTSLATTIGYRPYLGTGTKVRIGASGEIYVAGTFAQGFDLLPYGLHRLVGTVAPTIATQPQSQSATIGSDVTFSVTASPGLNVAYQWFKNGSQIAGANSSTLLLKNVQAGDAASYTVTLTNAVNYVTSNAATLSFGSTFSTWQQSKFTAGELLDSNISGPNAVYGQDGLPNILKYGLGLEPKQNITTGLPTVTTSGGNWVYTYVRPDNITDVTYQVEYSTDLTTWYTLSDVSIGDSGGLDTRQAVYPLSATNIYFRLRVSQP